MKNKKKLLQLKNICAAYGHAKILKDVNLTITENEFLGVIGPNGSGKTTLLKIMLGLLKPYSGEIIFNSPDTTLGYLPQFSVNDRHFPITVKEIVLSGLRSSKTFFKKDNTTQDKAAQEIIARLGISEIAEEPLKHLSGGQIQRALLGRALISKPDLLILDEPNTFIDKKFETDFFALLKELNESIAIVLVSHDTGIISSYVKSIACVNQTVHYHPANEIPENLLEDYNCPIELVAHGPFPHRVLKEHK